MSELICPLCGSANDPQATSCQVCNVEFNQLPAELNPMNQIAMPEKDSSLEPEEAPSEIPGWLKKRIPGRQDDQPPVSFDNYLNALFGKSGGAVETDAAESVSSPGLFDDEDLAALEHTNRTIQESAGLSEEEKKYSDFSHFRPEKKWDDPLPSAVKQPDLPADEKQYEDFSIVRPEKKWDDPLPTAVKQPDLPGDEKQYEDFSVIRPEKKWDDRPIYPSGDAVQEKTDENLNPIQNALEEPDALQNGGLFLDSDSDDQMALFDTQEAENRSSPTDFESVGISQDELPYVDFSVNRPARKWDDNADSQPTYSERMEASDQLLSVKNESSPEDLAAEEEESGGGLVDAFLSNIEARSPVTRDPNHDPAAFSGDVGEISASLDAQLNEPEIEIDEELESILNDSQPSYTRIPEPIEEILSESSTDNGTADDEIPAYLLGEDDDITPGNLEDQDDLDDVPWNLFESGEMNLPGASAKEPYRAFPKADLAEKTENQDYQQRMIVSILEKIFQIEGLNPALPGLKTRGSRKIAQFVLSLLLITGVALILVSNFTDRWNLSAPDSETFPALTKFNQILSSLETESRALVVVDYSPGYDSEMTLPLAKLLRQLGEKKIAVDLITMNPASAVLLEGLAQRYQSAAAIKLLGFQPGGVLALPAILGAAGTTAYQNIFLVTAEFDSARAWAEQLNLWADLIPTHVIASARLEALLLPYYESGLFETYLSGGLEKSLFSGRFNDDPLSSRKQFALWFLIGSLILAVIAGALQKGSYQSILIEPTQEPNLQSQPPATEEDLQPEQEFQTDTEGDEV